MSPSETIGDRVRRRRLELGLSQRQIDEPGLSYAYVSRIETGVRTPSMKALRKLAAKLDVNVYWLETGEDDPAEQLARLVLEYDGTPLPRSAVRLARRILG